MGLNILKTVKPSTKFSCYANIFPLIYVTEYHDLLYQRLWQDLNIQHQHYFLPPSALKLNHTKLVAGSNTSGRFESHVGWGSLDC